jgi:hypothetical protein
MQNQKSYIVIEQTDTGAAVLYQIKTALQTLPNKLESSRMTVIELPRCLEGGLGFAVVQRQWRLLDTEKSATATMRPAQIGEMIAWINRVIAAINTEVA